jgi:hypothetical protein
MSGEAS